MCLATTYFKVPKVSYLKYPIELRYRPSVPDNIKHRKAFHDDLEIKQFLELTGEFSTSIIDEDEAIETYQILSFSKNSIDNHNIIELKGNLIPKGLVPLERLFSKYDTLSNPTIQSSKENVISYNIGTEGEPKLVKICKVVSAEERKKYIKLLKEFIDIFAWSYEDLKIYDTNIIHIKFH